MVALLHTHSAGTCVRNSAAGRVGLLLVFREPRPRWGDYKQIDLHIAFDPLGTALEIAPLVSACATSCRQRGTAAGAAASSYSVRSLRASLPDRCVVLAEALIHCDERPAPCRTPLMRCDPPQRPRRAPISRIGRRGALRSAVARPARPTRCSVGVKPAEADGA